MSGLGWLVIHGEELMKAMRRCHEGESPDVTQTLSNRYKGHQSWEVSGLHIAGVGV